MSGVIDSNGQQWEHCNVCLEFVLIQDLIYEEPSPQHECGRSICPVCFILPEAMQLRIRKTALEIRTAEKMKHYEEMGWKVRLNPDMSISILEIPS